MHKIKQLKRIRKTISIPPDKSISHRAVIISALCRDKTVIKPFLRSEDTLATLECIKKLGVKAKLKGDSLIIQGRGMHFPGKRKVTLNAGESGTTMRILSGLLCAQKFPVEFKGKPSLNKRPMKRIIVPLSKMGARISGRAKRADIYPPLSIKPADKIRGGTFKLAVASAQVKSALMLAGLYADRPTVIKEPHPSRDHTERMLQVFKVKVAAMEKNVVCCPASELVSPEKLFVPADFSSASFLMVLGLILKNSRLLIKDVNINPSRCGLLKVLRRMGAKIKVKKLKKAYEPYADIEVESSELKAARVTAQEIPSLIDEIPILGVAAAFARGKTRISGLRELRVKESDRIKSLRVLLGAAGVESKIYGKDGLSITGGAKLRAASFNSFGDHRTAMSAVILGSLIGGCVVDSVRCIRKSFPQFISLINQLP